MDSLLSLDSLQELMRSVVSLPEHELPLDSDMPLPGYSIVAIHQAVRQFAAQLVQAVHPEQEPYPNLARPVGPQQRLRLTLFFREETIKCMKLTLSKGTIAGESPPPLEVGFFTIAHHGVEALFGFENFAGTQEQDVTHLSRHGGLSDRYRRLWRGMRWLCAYLLMLHQAAGFLRIMRSSSAGASSPLPTGISPLYFFWREAEQLILPEDLHHDR